MIIMLMRHGKAVSASVAGSDESRWLSEEGKEDVKRIIKCLERPTKVFTSPLRRAKETAEIVAKHFGVDVEVREELAPGRLNLNNLRKIAVPGSLYVGHNPDIEKTIGEMGCEAIKVSAGAVAFIDMVNMRLLSLIEPKRCPP